MKELTFREVIANIKEGEIWADRNYEISKDSQGLEIKRMDGFLEKDDNTNPLMYFYNGNQYKLKRKEYTFTEAFKAYEEGKIIESVETNTKFKRAENKLEFYKSKHHEKYIQCSYGVEFRTKEIRGKWYIGEVE